MSGPRSVRRLLVASCFASLIAGVTAADAQSLSRVVVLGDSLSAGFLISWSAAVPAVLEQALRQRGYAVSVINAAISGDTTSGGLARLDRDVPAGTEGVILELGANDRLRRVDPEVTRGALQAIVRRLKARGISVLLAGVNFSNTDDSEVVRFNAIFPAIARRYGLVYHPDFYAGISSDPSLTIFDGVHPSAAGVQRIVASILPAAERFIRTRPARPGAAPSAGRSGRPDRRP